MRRERAPAAPARLRGRRGCGHRAEEHVRELAEERLQRSEQVDTERQRREPEGEEHERATEGVHVPRADIRAAPAVVDRHRDRADCSGKQGQLGHRESAAEHGGLKQEDLLAPEGPVGTHPGCAPPEAAARRPPRRLDVRPEKRVREPRLEPGEAAGRRAEREQRRHDERRDRETRDDDPAREQNRRVRHAEGKAGEEVQKDAEPSHNAPSFTYRCARPQRGFPASRGGDSTAVTPATHRPAGEAATRRAGAASDPRAAGPPRAGCTPRDGSRARARLGCRRQRARRASA